MHIWCLLLDPDSMYNDRENYMFSSQNGYETLFVMCLKKRKSIIEMFLVTISCYIRALISEFTITFGVSSK